MSAEPIDEKAIFNIARRIAMREARADYLQQVCGDNPQTLARVAALLDVHDQEQSFLESPAVAIATIDEPLTELPGTQIGPYKLLQQIGEGGMGVVYMAEQTEPVKRKVALKLIKPGMDSRQVIARFEAERQALAMMDHVNIARVLDAGTTAPIADLRLQNADFKSEISNLQSAISAGRPYFVMELVKGIPITQYCDEHHLTPRQRLELLLPVCQAIQHAHQKGIIHRDIKPTNILVAEYDQQVVPKVIDFGVAKATSQPLTERTMFTGFGQLVGTLEYMSPEQAKLNQLDIDTRSDIYSLGVLMYELLTGGTPFDKVRLRSAGWDEMLRIIREEEPLKPSTKLSCGETLPFVAANRSMERSRLSRTIRGELDWIVMKALEKDRTRRYETANGFARDLQRYLANEPVQACPPSAGYRLRKFVRRNRGPVLAASLVLLALVAGIGGTTWGMIRAEQARRGAVAAQAAEAERAEGERRAKEEAQTRLTQIEKGTEILASVFRDMDPIAAEKAGVSSRDLLDRRLFEAAQQLEGEAVGDPLVVARLQHLLGTSMRNLGHLDQAEIVLTKACRTRQRLLGTDHLDTAAAKHDLALLYRGQRKLPLAEALLYKEVLAIRTAKLGAEDPDTIASQNDLAEVYHWQGKHDLAEALYKQVLGVRTAKLGAEHPDTLNSQYYLAGVYWSMKRLDQAIPLLEKTYNQSKANKHPTTTWMQADLGACYCDAGRFAEAIPLLEEVHQKGHPTLTWVGNVLLTSYVGAGKTTDAVALAKEQVWAAREQFPADSPELAAALAHTGQALIEVEAYADAEPLFKEVLAIRIARLGADHSDTILPRDGLARIYRSLKKPDQSIPLLEISLQLRKAQLDPDHGEILARQVTLGANYCEAGRFGEGLALIEEVRRKGRSDPHPAWVRSILLTADVQAGKRAEATALVAERVQEARQGFAAGCPPLAAVLANNGKVLLDVKAYSEAEALLLEAHQVLKQSEHEQDRLRNVLEWLAQLYDAWGKPDEAAKWRKELDVARATDQLDKSKGP